MKVSNRKCVRHLAWKSLLASRTRNLIAIVAIALTTMLFTSLFTIALSINDGFQQSNFRQVGGFSHGGFKYMTQAQFDELKDDPLIGQWGERRYLGMPREAPFNKAHVEVSFADANEAHWMYCDPVEGSLPQEGTDQAATGTHVLELLGIKPEIGAEFTLTFDVDGHETTQTFTLCGWWEYDEAIVANHVLIPESRVNEILAEVGVDPDSPDDGMTGRWNLDVMLKSDSRHIERDLNQILENHGYQSETAGDNYIDTGVNWGYTGARMSDIVDPMTVMAIAGVILLIVFTGYLIIYNVFQISVAGDFTASDFIVANAGKFQTSTLFSAEQAVPQSVIDDIDAQGGITDSGVVYGQTSPVLEYVTEDWFRQNKQNFYTPEEMDNLIRLTDKNEAGLLADGVQISGMSDFALDHLTVLEGDLSALYEPGSRAIAAVYSEDDYGNADMASHWARLGDTVTLRYVEESEYYDPDTGEVWASLEDVPDGANWVERPVKYRDVDYTVAALVTVPFALSYRYYGSDEFILNDETFVQDTGTSDVMYYAFDTTDETNAAMESFLADYTENVNPELDYESKATYAGEFESMRSMFLLLGGALSFIVGLVGVLNFFNAILTGIIARQRELAVLQAVGMTGRQLRAMLIWEGLLYALGAAGLALILTLTLGPIAFQAVEGLFWFFTYHLNLTPFLFIIPLFALLGAGIPVITGHEMAKRTVVERLRME